MLNIDSAALIEVAESIKNYELKLEKILGQKVKLQIVELEKADERNVFAEYLFMKKVVEATAKIGCVPVSELTGKSREQPLPELRFIAYTIIKDTFPKISQQTIGEMFSGRDHSTISSGLDKFKDLWNTEPDFRKKYLNIKNHIHATN